MCPPPEFHSDPALVISQMPLEQQQVHLKRIGKFHQLSHERFVEDNDGVITLIPTCVTAQNIESKTSAYNRKRREGQRLSRSKIVSQRTEQEERERLQNQANGLICSLGKYLLIISSIHECILIYFVEERLGWPEWKAQDVLSRMTVEDKKTVELLNSSILDHKLEIFKEYSSIEEFTTVIEDVRESINKIDDISSRIWSVSRKTYGHIQYKVHKINKTDEEEDFDEFFKKEVQKTRREYNSKRLKTNK